MNPPFAAVHPIRASRLGSGARGLVASVEGGECVVERLASLGLVPGTRVHVVRGGSPMAVAVGETRLALGHDWANALLVVCD